MGESRNISILPCSVSVFSEVDINNKRQVVDRLGLANAGFIRMESLSLNREGDLF